MIVNPHFSPTFTFNAKGQSVVVEQESEQDLVARGKNVCVCPQGFRPDQPEFGIPSPLFGTVPLNLAAVQSEVTRWANLDVTVQEHAKGLETAVRELEVSVTL